MLKEKLVYKIALATRTPIWTGDASGRVVRVLESGILGSLSWWTELIVRSAGVQAPEVPTESPNPVLEELFGSTRHSRPFRLLIDDATAEDAGFGGTGASGGQVQFILDESVGVKKDKDAPGLAHPQWSFKSKPRSGTCTLQMIRNPRYGNPEAPQVLHWILSFASRVGGIGAKTQFGCGLIDMEPPNGGDAELSQWLERVQNQGRSTLDWNLPSLQNLFWADIPLPGFLPEDNDRTPFLLRYRIREQYRARKGRNQSGSAQVQDPDVALRHLVCGWVPPQKVPGARRGSIFSISFPHQLSPPDGVYAVRIWGWLPRTAGNAENLFRCISEGFRRCFPHAGEIVFKRARLDPLVPATADQILRVLKGDL